MNVERLLAEIKTRYRNLQSYIDEGTFCQSRCGRTYGQTFRTAFLKPGKLLFESRLMRPDEPQFADLEKVAARLVVKGDTCELRYSHVIEPTVVRQSALFGAEMFSHSILNLVIPLLMPELELRSKILEDEFVLLSERSGGDGCYHLWCVEQRFHVWVRKDDFIIDALKWDVANPPPPNDGLDYASTKILAANPGDVLGRYDLISCDSPVKESTFSFDDFVQGIIPVDSITNLLNSAYQMH